MVYDDLISRMSESVKARLKERRETQRDEDIYSIVDALDQLRFILDQIDRLDHWSETLSEAEAQKAAVTTGLSEIIDF